CEGSAMRERDRERAESCSSPASSGGSRSRLPVVLRSTWFSRAADLHPFTEEARPDERDVVHPALAPGQSHHESGAPPASPRKRLREIAFENGLWSSPGKGDVFRGCS